VTVQLLSFLTLALYGQPRASAVLFASSCQYQHNRRLGGPCSWSGCFGEETNVLPLLLLELQIMQPAA